MVDTRIPLRAKTFSTFHGIACMETSFVNSFVLPVFFHRFHFFLYVSLLYIDFFIEFMDEFYTKVDIFFHMFELYYYRDVAIYTKDFYCCVCLRKNGA